MQILWWKVNPILSQARLSGLLLSQKVSRQVVLISVAAVVFWLTLLPTLRGLREVQHILLNVAVL